MNAPVRKGELLTPDEVVGEFFAPAATDLVTNLVGQYKQARERIGQVSAFAESDVCKSVIDFFLSGNATEERGRYSMQMSAAQLFQQEGAVAALNANYWSQALALTDVYDAMPQERRSQWNAQIRNPLGVKKHRGSDSEWETPPLPDFEEDTVRATLQGLLSSRAKFLAERVDGIFRALSGEHVTNSPAAFGKRMIIAHLISSYDTTNYDRAGYIHDLRCVIAKFMGRAEPAWNATHHVLGIARRERRGEWVTLDGGALRLRAYKVGTAHLEVHPDMAWRLNCVLAHLYPLAIPPEFRQKPKKQPKDFVMMGRPLPFQVVELLADMKREPTVIHKDRWTPPKPGYTQNPNALRFGRHDFSKDVIAEAERALQYIGGVKMSQESHSWFEFDYNPDSVLSEIVCSGCIPDQRAHQYYPTPLNVAKAAIELAHIGPDDECLEPSAGTGGLAELMPKSATTCVEISALHCKVLGAKGHNVVEADFLKWSRAYPFDRIVMNPPFSDGRWQAHLQHASTMLAPGGRLVAILPASARNKDVLPGWSCEWSRVMENEFAGTSADVVILAAER